MILHILWEQRLRSEAVVWNHVVRNKMHLIEGTEMSTMAELTHWVVDSDKVVTY